MKQSRSAPGPASATVGALGRAILFSRVIIRWSR